MDAEIKAKWVAALRSGKYAQGNAGLRNGNRFCCLGVLADVCGVKWLARTEANGWYDADKNGIGGYYGESAGLSIHDQRTLAQLNDVGKPFTEIADYIEANL